MSKLQFDFENIYKIHELRENKKEEILELVKNTPSEIIFEIASQLRDQRKGKTVSFSKKAFFNIHVIITFITKNIICFSSYIGLFIKISFIFIISHL